MKNFLLLLGIITVISSCDVVDEPYGPVSEYGWDPFFDETPVFNDTTVSKRRILLEEFTGHKCPNCPAGAEIAEDIKASYPDDFVSVGIHNSGAFSKVDMSNPAHPYPSDFETETGEKLRIKYQFSSFPGGMLNRSEIGGAIKIDYTKWETEVDALLANPAYTKPQFKLFLENTYNTEPGNESVRIKYKAQALQNLTGNFAIVAYVVESHIIAPQTDNSLSDPYVADYEHNHVLRVGFPNNGDGKTLFTDPSVGDEISVSRDQDFLFTLLNDDWVVTNMNVIVFIYNSVTGEIVQVEEMHMVN